MRRNMALVRAILEGVEALSCESVNGFSPFVLKDIYHTKELLYHVRLCVQAGLVTMGRDPFVKELTWQGHELLASLRNHDTPAG